MSLNIFFGIDFLKIFYSLIAKFLDISLIFMCPYNINNFIYYMGTQIL